MHSIRKFVGRWTLAIGLAALLAMAVSVQTGQAAKSARPTSLAHAVLPRSHELANLLPQHIATVTPSPQCTAAVNALKAALTNDRAEDNLEYANATPDTETGADTTEDANEAAALKPLFTAASTACGGALHKVQAPPVPKTPACAAAWQALKVALVQDRTEDQAEWTSGTEATAADQAEDQAEIAARKPLWAAVQAACPTTGSFTWYHH